MGRIEELRSRPATYDTLVKLSRISHGQVMEQVLRELELMDREREGKESRRANERNANHMLMIACEWLTSVTITWMAAHLFHDQALANYAATVGFTGAAIVTVWAWIKRY